MMSTVQDGIERPPASEGVPSKHPVYYFEDGSVILSAIHSQTTQVVLYRVQKTLLSLHSEVFAGMLRLPVPADAQMYEGVLLVQLPDTAEQVETMLDCLYKPNSLHQEMDAASQFWRDVMHISTKYAISDIRELVVEKLEKQWPTTLQEWTALDRHKERLHSDCLHSSGLQWDVDACYDNLVPEAASAIRLASDFDVPSIRPAAFYELSLIDPANDWDACRANKARTDRLMDGHRSARWHLLDHRDFRVLAIIQEAIQYKAIQRLYGKIEKTGLSGCAQAGVCRTHCRWSSGRFDCVRKIGILRFLGEIEEYRYLPQDGCGPHFPGVCKSCYREISHMAEDLREDIWEELRFCLSL